MYFTPKIFFHAKQNSIFVGHAKSVFLLKFYQNFSFKTAGRQIIFFSSSFRSNYFCSIKFIDQKFLSVP